MFSDAQTIAATWALVALASIAGIWIIAALGLEVFKSASQAIDRLRLDYGDLSPSKKRAIRARILRN